MGIARVNYRGRKWTVETDKEAIVGRCEVGLDTVIKLAENNKAYLEIDENITLKYTDMEKLVDKCAEVKINSSVTVKIETDNASVNMLIGVKSEDIVADSTMIKMIQQDTRTERDVSYMIDREGDRIKIKSKSTFYRRQTHGKPHGGTTLSNESMTINEAVKLQDGDKYLESILDNFYVVDHK